jgi:hypothetical protein
MNDLKTYFSELTAYEGSPARKLISPWSPENIKSITNDFRAAANKCQVQFDVPAGISDSALGNRVEKEAANGFNKVLQRHSLSECPGKGYPDQLLRRLRDDHLFVFELKAKTSFDRTDANRIVLTSATGKLRRHFARTKPPFGHGPIQAIPARTPFQNCNRWPAARFSASVLTRLDAL